MTVATTAEVSSHMAQRTTAFNQKVNNELMKKSDLSANEAKQVKEIIQEIPKIDQNKLKKGHYQTDKNIHVLRRDRNGQIAADLNANGQRGVDRVVFEEIDGKHYYVDRTKDHNYKGLKPSVTSDVRNFVDGSNFTKIFKNIFLKKQSDDDQNLDINKEK